MQHYYLLVVLASVIQFFIGALWYSPILFGKWWMQIMKVEHLSKDEMQKMQKKMMPFYGLQLFLTLFTTFSFANLAQFTPSLNIYHLGFWLWIGFIAPLQIASVIWGNTDKKFWLKQMFIMTSYQLVGMLIAAFILSL